MKMKAIGVMISLIGVFLTPLVTFAYSRSPAGNVSGGHFYIDILPADFEPAMDDFDPEIPYAIEIGLESSQGSFICAYDGAVYQDLPATFDCTDEFGTPPNDIYRVYFADTTHSPDLEGYEGSIETVFTFDSAEVSTGFVPYVPSTGMWTDTDTGNAIQGIKNSIQTFLGYFIIGIVFPLLGLLLIAYSFGLIKRKITGKKL